MPQIREVMSLAEALAYAEQMDVKLVPYEMEESLVGASGMEGTRRAIESIAVGQAVAVFIGPEGGFEEAEVEQAVALGAAPVTLGRRILRTETAGFVMLSMLLYHLE